ncbi:MAG: energy transducer TonB [Opitutales bacterium]|jgi:periplasmic protein TonB|nr:energy transducer TonB [Opitutales bacterium]MDP4645230.1 energy transducer TonB [Opitutales bacterium]MDP4694634.1 energy transducer TonB [Opitutales bacterium]MDP4778293.1 energy transducer TonB [Opitutales bacterium]MDP4878747.1 energy transducer TonB [Opitutales bacterium]
MSSAYKPPQGKGTLSGGALLGIGVSAMLFLAIPLTQIFTQYEKQPVEIEALDMATPPPPPPPDEPPPPPEPEDNQPPPELNSPPPPITLEQLDMALNPGTGTSLGGDFAMPSFDISQKDLGGLEIFDLSDVDKHPRPTKQTQPVYPIVAKRKGQEGRVTIEFIVDENGNVTNTTIVQSTDPIFERPTIDAVQKWKFDPGEKDGRKVKIRVRVPIPFTME